MQTRLGLFATFAVLSLLPVSQAVQPPGIDYHQHLFSPAAGALVAGKPDSPGISARDLVALLDAAGIQRAVVLSMGYTWGKASRAPIENEYEQVKTENDWTAQQVAQYPDRLRAFCSFNPLKAYALTELARCSKDPQLRHGLKLHFGNSDVDYDNPENVVQARKVFAAANGYRMPIVVHMHASLDMKRRYGADQARVFVKELLPAALDVPVQIAHLAGSGGYNDHTDAALGVFADALAKTDAHLKNVWFDASAVVRAAMTTAELQRIATRIRQIGIDRVLFGSDAAASPQAYPKAAWETFQRLPLTPAEFRTIASNVAPYMKDQRSGLGPNGHTMVVIPRGEFVMGSPSTERGRSEDETAHRVRIDRTYAIATTETTNEQFARFLAAVPDYAARWRTATTARFGDPPRFAAFSRTPDSPQVGVSWYDAARYCNWLSEQAGIPKSQWIYPVEVDPAHGIDLPPDYLSRAGYRLPTEAEWEYAARGGTTTARHFGDDDSVLPKYAWYDGNTRRERAYPVAQLLPNPWGLFDMLGNVWEWTFDRRRPYPSDGSITSDVEDSILRVSNDVARTRRGGSFAYDWSTVRSAHRGDVTYFPNQTRDNVGFRVARTMTAD